LLDKDTKHLGFSGVEIISHRGSTRRIFLLSSCHYSSSSKRRQLFSSLRAV